MQRLFFVIIPIFIGVLAYSGIQGLSDKAPVKVGILFSLTGPMAKSEAPLVDSALFAVEEINAAGGVLGQKIMPVVVDGKSDWNFFAREAERLIVEEKVAALFACWTSACRKAVKPIVEKHDHLMFYPLQYEGLEQSPNILYTGAAPNQQIIPALIWGINHFGKRIFLVGSDYVFPRVANLIIKEVAAIQGASIEGEMYVPLGSDAVAPVVAEITRLKPDLVLNTINGNTNYAFFNALKEEGITADDIPVLSFSIAEAETAQSGGSMSGHYAAWSYFQSIDTPRNRAFISDFTKRHGANSIIDDPMEAAYIGVHLWARAVRDAESFNEKRVNHALMRQSLNAPQGIVSVDPQTRHLWRAIRVGRVREDGQFDVVWTSGEPARPSPFPMFRTSGEWLKKASDFL